jgi:hypothetical protein
MAQDSSSEPAQAGIILHYHGRYTCVVSTNTRICRSTPLTSMEHSPNIDEPLLLQENEFPEKPPLRCCEFRIRLGRGNNS